MLAVADIIRYLHPNLQYLIQVVNGLIGVLRKISPVETILNTLEGKEKPIVKFKLPVRHSEVMFISRWA